MAFAMVETRAALDALDDILDTPGIDGIFLGPSDFSIAWTNGATVNSTLEDMMETIASVAERTRKAGKHAAIYVVEPAIAGRVVSMGYRLLAIGSEHAVISLGAKTLLKGIKIRSAPDEAPKKLRLQIGQELGEGHRSFGPRAVA